MFAKRKQLEHIPPTQTALLEHTKRTIYQGSHVWGETLVPLQNLPSPGEWGWQQDDNNNWVANVPLHPSRVLNFVHVQDPATHRMMITNGIYKHCK